MAGDSYEAATDEELAKQLHQLLIVEGHESVTIVHPIEGNVIVTKESYEELTQALIDVKEMSPAQRIQARTKHENKQKARLRKALNDAEVRHVDITLEDGFGLDIEGQDIDMDGCTFLPAAQYIEGVLYPDNEVGAFVEQNEMHEIKAPIRIRHVGSGSLSDAMQELSDQCPPEDLEKLVESLETRH
jgi:hypothetical protein